MSGQNFFSFFWGRKLEVLPQMSKGERQEMRTTGQRHARGVLGGRAVGCHNRALNKSKKQRGKGGWHLKVSVKVTQPCDSPLKLVHLHGGLEVLQSVRRGEWDQLLAFFQVSTEKNAISRATHGLLWLLPLRAVPLPGEKQSWKWGSGFLFPGKKKISSIKKKHTK